MFLFYAIIYSFIYFFLSRSSFDFQLLTLKTSVVLLNMFSTGVCFFSYAFSFVLFLLFRNFEHLIPDAPELIHDFLVNEKDASCKRNAFMMLIHADQVTLYSIIY